MEPDRFAVIEADEQRAVVAINEEYLKLQGRVPAIEVEAPRRHRRMVLLALLAVLVAAAVLAWWFLR
jgi:hypothetical protein